MTRKELIEGGWIDKYILGLTSDDENHEVERLATIYPDVQEEINSARGRLCGKFNRSLTQPAMRNRFVSKRRLVYGSTIVIVLLCASLLLLWKQHFSLKQEFISQRAQIAQDEITINELASFNKITSDNAVFLNAEDTKRIKLAGCGATPDAEVMVFQCQESGKMMLRVIELPELKGDQYFEVRGQKADNLNELLGRIYPPVRFDSLYVLTASLASTAFTINMVTPVTNATVPVCLTASAH